MTTKKWVLTGATGLIGDALVKEIVRREGEVVILSRKAKPAAGSVRTVLWTPTEAGSWCEELEGADVVAHLAGAPIAEGRWTPEHMKDIRDSRVVSGKIISSALAKTSTKPSVYASFSAVGFYGMRKDDVLCDEATPHGNDVLGELTREWEESANEARDAGIRVVHPRVGVVLGKDGGMLAKMLPPFRAFVGGPLGDGKQWIPWVHIEDIVAAVLFGIDTESMVGPYNASAPEPVTMNEFAKVMGEVLSRPSLMRVPAFALHAAFGEMANVILSGQRAIPSKLEKAGFAFRYRTLKAALLDLVRSA